MRTAISKKTRFEIFKRDEFCCVYCGKQPPEVCLVLEHILAVAKGGTDAIDNLCTSCEACNQGKGARSLEQAPPNAMERLAFLQERLEAIQALQNQAVMSQHIAAQEAVLRQHITNFWCAAFEVDSCPMRVITMICNRLKWIDVDTMRKLIESCATYTGSRSETTRMKYMAGILRRHLAEKGIDYQKEIGGVA